MIYSKSFLLIKYIIIGLIITIYILLSTVRILKILWRSDVRIGKFKMQNCQK